MQYYLNNTNYYQIKQNWYDTYPSFNAQNQLSSNNFSNNYTHDIMYTSDYPNTLDYNYEYNSQYLTTYTPSANVCYYNTNAPYSCSFPIGKKKLMKSPKQIDRKNSTDECINNSGGYAFDTTAYTTDKKTEIYITNDVIEFPNNFDINLLPNSAVANIENQTMLIEQASDITKAGKEINKVVENLSEYTSLEIGLMTVTGIMGLLTLSTIAALAWVQYGKHQDLNYDKLDDTQERPGSALTDITYTQLIQTPERN